MIVTSAVQSYTLTLVNYVILFIHTSTKLDTTTVILSEWNAIFGNNCQKC